MTSGSEPRNATIQENSTTEGEPQEGAENLPVATDSTSTTRMVVNFEQYQRITNMLVMHIQRHGSMSLPDLENWYLSQRESDGGIESSEDLRIQSRLIRKIIRRLITRDHVLIETEHNHVIVHPNYDLDNENSISSTARE